MAVTRLLSTKPRNEKGVLKVFYIFYYYYFFGFLFFSAFTVQI